MNLDSEFLSALSAGIVIATDEILSEYPDDYTLKMVESETGTPWQQLIADNLGIHVSWVEARTGRPIGS